MSENKKKLELSDDQLEGVSGGYTMEARYGDNGSFVGYRITDLRENEYEEFYRYEQKMGHNMPHYFGDVNGYYDWVYDKTGRPHPGDER